MEHKLRRGVLVAVLVCAIVQAGSSAGWFQTLDYAYYDLWHRISGVRFSPEHTAIVAIDDQTLLEHQDEPLVFWGPYFAKAMEVLRSAGARIIGLDFLLSMDAESWIKKLELSGSEKSRTYDLPLRVQIAAGRVALVGYLSQDVRGEGQFLLPMADYLAILPHGIADVGLANLFNDPDGTCRHFVPALLERGFEPRLTFAALLAVRAAELDPESPAWTLGNRQVPNEPVSRPIGFVGPPQTIPRVPFRLLLRPEALNYPEIQALKGKVVIIAAEHIGTADIHFTPYARGFWGWEGTAMSGPELHANIVETLLSGRFPRPVPFWVNFIYLLGVVSAAGFIFIRVSPTAGLGISLLFGVCAAVLAFLFFRSNLVLPVAKIQAGLLLSYLGTLGFRLTREERQRAYLQQLFGRYVSEEVVAKILAGPGHPDLGGELLQVTVLFSDIRNFTSISERLTPKEVVEMLNTFLGELCAPILAQGGMVDKFIGDAVMAVFGAPAPHRDHARRAIKAALAMSALTENLQSWMRARFGDRDLPEFHFGIGIHTGEAVIGNVGSTRRTEFTAIGDTVNIASRLEGKTKDLGWTILASADTIKAAGPGVVTGGTATAHLKGREEPVEVFEVIGIESGEGEGHDESLS